MASRWQHCLHRVSIDTLRAKRVARKFELTGAECLLFELFNEFHFDWNVEVSLVASVA
jgi:hypothetical protein